MAYALATIVFRALIWFAHYYDTADYRTRIILTDLQFRSLELVVYFNPRRRKFRSHYEEQRRREVLELGDSRFYQARSVGPRSPTTPPLNFFDRVQDIPDQQVLTEEGALSPEEASIFFTDYHGPESHLLDSSRVYQHQILAHEEARTFFSQAEHTDLVGPQEEDYWVPEAENEPTSPHLREEREYEAYWESWSFSVDDQGDDIEPTDDDRWLGRLESLESDLEPF